MPAITSQRILEVGMGFWPAKVLLSAVEVGVFSALGTSAKTAEGLRAEIGLHPRAIPAFRGGLVALRFLERDGNGATARYRNTAETGAFLDRRSPRYVGGFLEMANARLYPFWGDLTEGLRGGQAQNGLKRTGAAMFDELYRDPARLEQFMNAMSGISADNFSAFAATFDFSGYRTL